MTKLQRHFVELSLKLLGESTRSDFACAQKHHNIFGITLVSIGCDAATQDLYDIETASTRLWLHAKLGDE